jgi:hypothetical protein
MGHCIIFAFHGKQSKHANNKIQKEVGHHFIVACNNYQPGLLSTIAPVSHSIL